MTVFKIVGIAVLSVAAVLTVRAYKPELALPISIAAGITLLLTALDSLTSIRDFIMESVEKYGLNAGYMVIILKVTGIAYLVQFASKLCSDSGESAISAKVELCGRVLIIAVSLPAIISVLELIASLAEGI